ncbi:tubulin specific chaperone cofactor C [Schizosaccharomyces cryophilus OY26]|uniref:Tubulin specific chaperone cofactor C n=1 Tax=Schizosaccharomyces cryophilus (strain OY26 / ATCC MYA-4695 / CBS 11777 / NBRC 106824 / NRRL Y48691) TaxID=653667 RepID=S9VYJ2_SCHCR|nr:tubulin specific chaperone cofactor C [Schizosaccharomyces cryophilus OY26]EPY52738.1 tubulin specific chaperone cofactor C [Schizosaccharomyces cryophilus OY26]
MEEQLILLRKEFLQRLYKNKPAKDASREEIARWLENRSQEVSKMTDIVNEGKEQLAPYDRMKYMEQLSDLIVRLHETRSEIFPRPPFRFHRSYQLQQQAKPVANRQKREDVKVKRFENETLFLSNLSNETLDNSLFDHQEERPIKLIIRDLQGCNVYIPNCSAVHIDSSKDCSFHFGNIRGSLHISQLKSSQICASCHQFRLHESNHLSIQLHCQTSPVLEGCSNIIFENPSVHPILDFSWARPDASPNFKVKA